MAAGKVRERVSRDVAERAVRKLFLLDTVTRVEDLRVPPGNRLETLGGDRRGQHSIRVNERWRICFVWRDHVQSDRLKAELAAIEPRGAA